MDTVPTARDHRFIDHGDGGDRAFARCQPELRFRERLAHEELVIHGSMLADDLTPTVAGAGAAESGSQPSRDAMSQ
jgi:hypothetical protein